MCLYDGNNLEIAGGAGEVAWHRTHAGALSLPDIGQIFPDNDPKWAGASSDIFVKEACKLMRERGYTLGNIDCTLIAQKPKLSPHKEDIRCGVPSHVHQREELSSVHDKVY